MENKKTNIQQILSEQRDFFNSGATLSIELRREKLKKLYSAILESESEIYAALKSDLGKSDFESFMCEIGMTLEELSFMIKNIKKLSREHRVKTPIAQFASRSFTKPTPYGNVLIMSPWNYPFLLTLSPLADAIAAGNTAIVKPSAYSPATSEIIKKLIAACFDSNYVAVVCGGRKENSALLEEKFDMVFFTGSQAVGKEVLRHTAEHLTPAVLELGGKSPCIVDESADIALSARRIVFGKYLNCGQTCVSPDYILCHSSIKNALVSAIKDEIVSQFGESPLDNPDYGHIVNQKHFERLISLIDSDKVAHGGDFRAESLQITPTVLDGIDFSHPIMQDEIFGPLLPVLTFEDFDDIYGLLADKQKPLALYLFSSNKKRIKEATARLRFGGGCINDTIIHLATAQMGFGGVGESGMGAYHGKAGFETFSHTKSIVDKKTFIDLPMRYQPYNRKKHFKTIRNCMK